MRFLNAKQDVQFILSWFQEAFSSPSFKLFSSFILGFIQLGKEGHTSSKVQSLARSFLSRSLSSFTRFLGKNAYNGPRNLDRVICYTWERKRGGPSGEFEEAASAVV